jgi:hypothetical protein
LYSRIAAPVQVGSYVRLNDMIALIGANRTSRRMFVATVWASAAVWARGASEAVLGSRRQEADKSSQAQWAHLTTYETVFAEVSAAAQASTTAAPV